MYLLRTLVAAPLSLSLLLGAIPGANGATRTASQSVTIARSDLAELLDAYSLIKMQYVNQVDDRKLLGAAIGGMLKSLDPHSDYLDKEGMLALERETSGQYVGIGMEVAAENGMMRVQSLAEDGPAERGGVRAGDRVIALGGQAVTGLAYAEIARRVRGAPGSVLEVVLAREGEARPRTLHLVRAALRSDSVTLRSAGKGLAWIRIAEFARATGADLNAALVKAGEGGTPPGLILDLRNDPGGLVNAAADVAAAFLAPDQALFLVRGRGAEERVDVGMGGTPGEGAQGPGAPAWARTVPLVVLVNGASASAAELLAGALQDHGRATVVGSRTFGKGSIQTVIPLSEDSAVKMTVARYATPLGREIQATGLAPDIAVGGTGRGALLLHEADLANHLPALDGAGPGTPAAADDARLFGSASDLALAAAVAQLQPPAPPTAALARRWHAWMARLGR